MTALEEDPPWAGLSGWPAGRSTRLADVTTLDDAAIVERCQFLFAHMMNDDLAAWEALGDEYHARLAKNF